MSNAIKRVLTTLAALATVACGPTGTTPMAGGGDMPSTAQNE